MTFAQGKVNIAFEQIAFDFYKDSILNIYPPKKKLILWVELRKDNIFSTFPDCLKNFNISRNVTFNINPSGCEKLIIIEDKRFKIKKENSKKYPQVYCTVSFSNKSNQHIVTITEDYLYEGITYHIEMDDFGKVNRWCQGGWL